MLRKLAVAGTLVTILGIAVLFAPHEANAAAFALAVAAPL